MQPCAQLVCDYGRPVPGLKLTQRSCFQWENKFKIASARTLSKASMQAWLRQTETETNIMDCFSAHWDFKLFLNFISSRTHKFWTRIFKLSSQGKLSLHDSCSLPLLNQYQTQVFLFRADISNGIWQLSSLSSFSRLKMQYAVGFPDYYTESTTLENIQWLLSCDILRSGILQSHSTICDYGSKRKI